MRKIGHEWAFGGSEAKGDEAAPTGLNWVREYFGKVLADRWEQITGFY